MITNNHHIKSNNWQILYRRRTQSSKMNQKQDSDKFYGIITIEVGLDKIAELAEVFAKKKQSRLIREILSYQIFSRFDLGVKENQQSHNKNDSDTSQNRSNPHEPKNTPKIHGNNTNQPAIGEILELNKTNFEKDIDEKVN